ncbi:2'-5' RNA ligase family protein [Myroides sp. LJL115]
MNPLNKYSICFLPDQNTLEIVAAMKTDLSSEIGWFNSKNAIGHITIMEFQTTQQQIKKVDRFLVDCCSYFSPIQSELEAFNSFPNGAFFLEIDPISTKTYQDYATEIFKGLTIKNAYKSTTPHLTIARKLTSGKLQQAFDFFQNPAITMQCNQIALRRLNQEKLQFEIIATYTFKQKEKIEKQLTLF